MRMKSFAVALALALVSVTIASPAPAFGQLSKFDEEAIEKMVLGIAQSFVKATDAEAVVKARKRLIGEYQAREATKQQGFTVAKHAARHLTPLLATGLREDVPLRTMKVVNLAMGLSGIWHTPIQPALDAMVAHRNAAVRLLGWTGYRRARGAMLVQSKSLANKMFAAQDKAADTETAPVVQVELYRMLSLPANAPAGVTGDLWNQARTRAEAALQRNLRRCARQVIPQEAEMADMTASEKKHYLDVRAESAIAARALLKAILSYGPAPQAENKAKKPFIQMAYDLAWFSSVAYKEIEGQGQVGLENAVLLRDCERALGDLSGTGRRWLTPLLTQKDPDPTGVRLKVIQEWIEALKGPFQTVQPPLEEMPPAKPAPPSTAPGK